MLRISCREPARCSDEENVEQAHGAAEIHRSAGLLHRLHSCHFFYLRLQSVHAVYLLGFKRGMVFLLTCLPPNEVEEFVKYICRRDCWCTPTLHWNFCLNGNTLWFANYLACFLYLFLAIPSLLWHPLWKQRWLQEGRFCNDIGWRSNWLDQSIFVNDGLQRI